MGARILVIEDNPANLELMMYLLGALGYQAISAVDGSDGLARVRKELPDLVICDLQLPHVDGYEVARRMKGDPELEGIPIIAVTAFAMPGDRERALAAGFNGYISKPIMPERFVHQIGQFLSQPIQPAAAQASDHSASEHPSPETRATVLVIESHTPTCRRVGRTLESRGFRLLFASSAEEAVRLRLADDVDFVLAGEGVDPATLAALGRITAEQFIHPIPLDSRQLISSVETLLAERMRVT